MTDGDCEEFTHNHRVGELERDTQIWNQEWKGMERAAQAGDDARNCTTSQRAAASGNAFRRRTAPPKDPCCYAASSTRDALSRRPVRPVTAKIGAGPSIRESYRHSLLSRLSTVSRTRMNRLG